jgi:hypothetical protein
MYWTAPRRAPLVLALRRVKKRKANAHAPSREKTEERAAEKRIVDAAATEAALVPETLGEENIGVTLPALAQETRGVGTRLALVVTAHHRDQGSLPLVETETLEMIETGRVALEIGLVRVEREVMTRILKGTLLLHAFPWISSAVHLPRS